MRPPSISERKYFSFTVSLVTRIPFLLSEAVVIVVIVTKTWTAWRHAGGPGQTDFVSLLLRDGVFYFVYVPAASMVSELQSF